MENDKIDKQVEIEPVVRKRNKMSNEAALEIVKELNEKVDELRIARVKADISLAKFKVYKIVLCKAHCDGLHHLYSKRKDAKAIYRKLRSVGLACCKLVVFPYSHNMSVYDGHHYWCVNDKEEHAELLALIERRKNKQAINREQTEKNIQ